MKIAAALKWPPFHFDNEVNPYRNLVVDNTDNFYDVLRREPVLSHFRQMNGHLTSAPTLK